LFLSNLRESFQYAFIDHFKDVPETNTLVVPSISVVFFNSVRLPPLFPAAFKIDLLHLPKTLFQQMKTLPLSLYPLILQVAFEYKQKV